MAVATRGTSSNYLQRAPSPSGLADVLDVILDKGLVIDAFVRVSVIGIELITIDARIVVASVDTYLRFAEAVNRLDLEQQPNNLTLEDLQNRGSQSMGREKGERALERAKDRVTPGGGGGDEGNEENQSERAKVREKRGAHQDDGGGGEGKGGLRGALGKVADRARWS